MPPVIWCELKINAQVQVLAWTLIWTFFSDHRNELILSANSRSALICYTTLIECCIQFRRSVYWEHSYSYPCQGKALKFNSFGKKWTLTPAQLMDQLFWVATQMKFKGRGVSPYKKRRNYSFWMSWQEKKISSSSFLAGGTSFFLNFFELQLKKVHPWVGKKLKFSFCPINWTLIALAVKQC